MTINEYLELQAILFFRLAATWQGTLPQIALAQELLNDINQALQEQTK